MPVYHYREKLLNSIVHFTKNTKYCGKTKLYKLLYYLDFTHFKEIGQSVTDLEYYTWDFGPAPQKLHNDIENLASDICSYVSIISITALNKTFFSIKPKKKFDSKHFTKREIRILNELCEKFKDAKSEDMVEASHMTNEPWDITKKTVGMYKVIDYLLAIDDSPESISREEAEDLAKDRCQLESAFK